jgi:hypothetical protein
MKEISFTGDGHRKPVQQKGIADSVFTVYVKFAAGRVYQSRITVSPSCNKYKNGSIDLFSRNRNESYPSLLPYRRI